MPLALCVEGLFDWEKLRTETQGCCGPFSFTSMGSFLEVSFTYNTPMTKGDRRFGAFSDTCCSFLGTVFIFHKGLYRVAASLKTSHLRQPQQLCEGFPCEEKSTSP